MPKGLEEKVEVTWLSINVWWEQQPTPLTCYYCFASPLSRELPVKDPLRATLDHKIPLSKRGSTNLKKNGVIACYPCNRDKGVLLPDEFRAVLRFRNRRDALRKLRQD